MSRLVPGRRAPIPEQYQWPRSGNRVSGHIACGGSITSTVGSGPEELAACDLSTEPSEHVVETVILLDEDDHMLDRRHALRPGCACYRRRRAQPNYKKPEDCCPSPAARLPLLLSKCLTQAKEYESGALASQEPIPGPGRSHGRPTGDGKARQAAVLGGDQDLTIRDRRRRRQRRAVGDFPDRSDIGIGFDGLHDPVEVSTTTKPSWPPPRQSAHRSRICK